jgi:Predicted transcriptional regulator
LDSQPGIAVGTGNRNGDPFTRGCVFHGIVNQYPQGLFDKAFIRVYENGHNTRIIFVPTVDHLCFPQYFYVARLSIDQIIEKLKLEFIVNDIKINKRSIIKDIEALRESGFKIAEIRKPEEHYKNTYSNQNKLFELDELRILIDAISSARFITPEVTKQIINKIKKLTGLTMAKKLQNQILIDGLVKADNNQVRQSVDILHTAISERKKVSFQYGNYNMKKEFTLHRNKEFYPVDPYKLVWNNDFYYLVGILNNEPTFRNFRVDRMRNVKLEELKYKKIDLDVSAFLKHIFFMFPGESEIVKIQFDKHLINAVLDRFGNDLDVRQIDERKFEIRFKAALSEGLIRWILMWGSDAKVISPNSLVERLRDESKKMQELYLK